MANPYRSAPVRLPAPVLPEARLARLGAREELLVRARERWALLDPDGRRDWAEELAVMNDWDLAGLIGRGTLA